MTTSTLAITRQQAIAAFPPRPRDSHKGLCGTVAIIGGSNGMVGAALLAGRAALKLGAGIVHVGLLADCAPAVDMMQPELMLHVAQDTLRLHKLDALAIGNGLGRSPAALQLLRDALTLPIPLVLDADALSLLAEHEDLRGKLNARTSPSILTPHPGEAARLLGIQPVAVQADRTQAIQHLAQKFSASIVLKGADSLVTTRTGQLYVNHSGNPGMSSAGMGDVLSGMIAALVAQGMSADDALILAVHLHGAAGDALAEQLARIGMSASEVAEWARWLLNQWIGER